LTFYFIFVVDDLVIIGATPAGIEAALLAVHLKKRVALVQQPSSGNLEASEDIFSKGYSQIFHLYKLLNHWQETAVYSPMATVAGMAVSLAPILRRLGQKISLIIKELRFYRSC
jgi:heterodisulfide reductase subunit A-like polyferredoxin